MNEDKNQNLLIYIDDPISSLDNNITYQISKILIKLKKKLKEYTDTRLFVSTHNWYLFYLLNRHKPLTKEGNTYTIFKNNKNKTVISELIGHKKLSYFADYPLAFKEIYDFSEIDKERLHSEDYDYFGIPNKARKIIENYMHFKYGTDKWEDEEAIEIKDSFSPESHDHTANILPPETIQNNVKILLEYIKEKDSSHYDAMIRKKTK
jgi:wobble nucleotide-excising tRNase